MEFCESQREIK